MTISLSGDLKAVGYYVATGNTATTIYYPIVIYHVILYFPLASYLSRLPRFVSKRPISTFSIVMESPASIKVSEGESVESVLPEILALIDKSGWELLNDDTIRKTFHFKTYTKVLVGLH